MSKMLHENDERKMRSKSFFNFNQKSLILFSRQMYSHVSSDFFRNMALADGSDGRRHGTGLKPTFRRRISRIKPLDTRWYVPGCVYIVGVTRT